jgi:hypothetical protein
MKRYKNRSNESGVVAYEIGRSSIVVKFVNGEKYLYTHKSAGAQNIALMQKLPKDGTGLSTFISQHVHGRYAKVRVLIEILDRLSSLLRSCPLIIS